MSDYELKRINALTEASAINDSDVFAIDSAAGTKKVAWETLKGATGVEGIEESLTDLSESVGDLKSDLNSLYTSRGNFGDDYVIEYTNKTVNDYNGKLYLLDRSGYVTRIYKADPDTVYSFSFSTYTHLLGADRETIVSNGGSIITNATTVTTNSSTAYIAICYATASYPNWYISQGNTLVTTTTVRINNLIEVADIVVDKSGRGDYTTLTEAVNNATDGDIIFVKAGIYDGEEVEAYDKELSIIGENPRTTVIMNGLDLYARPPIEMSKGLLKNLYFWSYGVDGGDNRHAYALHIDNDSLENKTFTAENCIFKSRSGYSAVGLGLRKGCVVTFKHCHFITNTGVPFFGNEATNQQTHGVQQLNLYNCIFEALSAQRAMILRGMKVDGNEVWCEFINNVFSSLDTTLTVRLDYTSPEYAGSGTTMGNMGLINWNLSSNSIGNNITQFNIARTGTTDIIE